MRRDLALVVVELPGGLAIRVQALVERVLAEILGVLASRPRDKPGVRIVWASVRHALQ